MEKKIDILGLEEITPSKGGVRQSSFSINRNGYFRINKRYKQDYGLSNKKSVNIRAGIRDEKIVVAFSFFDDKNTGSFTLVEYPKTGSLSFSGRSMFSKLGLKYYEVVSNKSLQLKPRTEEIDGLKYFIVEIPIKTIK